MKRLAKYHKWISIIFTVFIILFSVSGIILNHRKLLSGIDISRSLLPKEYTYTNWNNAAVRSTIKLNPDTVLIYGNIGIWLTDSSFKRFNDFNQGFPEGQDNRKINKIVRTNSNQLLAGTFFGLFIRNNDKWIKIDMPVKNECVTDLLIKNDTVFILTRSYLLKSSNLKQFEKITIPPPVNYDNKIGLFKTLWVIHSGEIYGELGRILVDIIALILMFLTISGFIFFINKIILKKFKNKDRNHRIKLSNRFLIKWHNKLGWTTIIFLVITSATGIFLRPPFLIPIANATVGKIPFSELDSDNAWFDKLRRILYDDEKKTFLISTSDGMFYSDDNFKTELKIFRFQPPVSVMGLNVFKKVASDQYMIGSFEGLFLWKSQSGRVFDLIMNEPYIQPTSKSKPIGQFLITGFSNDFDNDKVFFDYNLGACDMSEDAFPIMPDEIKNQPISLWNISLEVHTGRIFQNILSDFYILIVPLTGLALLFILISGFIVWYKSIK